MTRVSFATPHALWLLLVLPIWWVLRAYWRPPTITFSRAAIVARGPMRRGLYPRLVFAARNLVLAGLVLALARPRVRHAVERTRRVGINIMLVTDVSSSMLAQDFAPENRLAVAKETMQRFVAGRGGDRIGLVAFAGDAVTQVPLTTDHAVVQRAIYALRAGQLEDGTALGDALAAATNRLRRAPGPSRVAIVITDGVSNRGFIDPLTAAKAAALAGVTIYPIGVGTVGTALVPAGRAADGTPRLERRPVELDERLLARVARLTGGRYFRAQDAAALRRVYAAIDQMARVPLEATTTVRYAELFPWPLAGAVLVLLLELLLEAARGTLP